MKDLGEAKKILGIEITRDKSSGRLWLFHENYVLRVLEKIEHSKSKTSYYSFARSLQVILQTVSKINGRGEDVSSTIF